MSETTSPAPSTEAVPNAPSVDPAPQPEAVPTPKPDAPAEPAEQTEEQKQRTARDEEGRRVAGLRARLGTSERERERLATENEYWRQQSARLPPQQPTPEQEMTRIRAQARAEVEQELVVRRFHDEGRAAFRDWDQKCKELMDLGADAGVAALLVETPGGVQLAAALADDPEEVQRIANIRTAAGRAVALGKYAATLDGGSNGLERVPRTAPGATAQVTRAPAPIRPVQGRASPVFNEYTATSQELVDHYFKQNIERQKR